MKYCYTKMYVAKAHYIANVYIIKLYEKIPYNPYFDISVYVAKCHKSIIELCTEAF